MTYQLNAEITDTELLEFLATGAITPEIESKLRFAAARIVERKHDDASLRSLASHKFEFCATGTETNILDGTQIWPDIADAPLSPTLLDVKKVIKDYGGDDTVIDDWNLNRDMVWRLTVKKVQ